MEINEQLTQAIHYWGERHDWDMKAIFAEIEKIRAERTHRSPSQPAENQENRPKWELAKERVVARWPDAIVCGGVNGGTRVWTDKGNCSLGSSPIPLYQTKSAEAAWIDADRNQAALPAVQTQPPPSHPAPRNQEDEQMIREAAACGRHVNRNDDEYVFDSACMHCARLRKNMRLIWDQPHPAPKDSQQSLIDEESYAIGRRQGMEHVLSIATPLVLCAKNSVTTREYAEGLHEGMRLVRARIEATLAATPEVRHAPSSEINNGGLLKQLAEALRHAVEHCEMGGATESWFRDVLAEYDALPKPPQFPEPRNEESHE